MIVTGPSSVAQRVRGLQLGADAWVTKPCHAEELICIIEAAIRRHRRNEMPDLDDRLTVGEITITDLSGLCGQGEPRAYGARVRDPAPALAVRPRAPARGDLRARVGLRDGPRRSLGRRFRSQAAPEAADGVAAVELHPHALRCRYRFAPERDGTGGASACPRSAICSTIPASWTRPSPAGQPRLARSPSAEAPENASVTSRSHPRHSLGNALTTRRERPSRRDAPQRTTGPGGAGGRPAPDPPRRASGSRRQPDADTRYRRAPAASRTRAPR